MTADAPSMSPDPIVAALLAAHRARKAFPAGHVFAMTNPIQNGHIVMLAVCSCGVGFAYHADNCERMDAAIEAHLQKFDHLPEKVDGRGQAIPSSDGPELSGDDSLRRGAGRPNGREMAPGPSDSLHDAGGQSPASGPAPDLVPSSGAGDIQAAQICASKDYDALPLDVRAQAEADGTEDLLKAAIALAWKDTSPPRDEKANAA
jgi:hypothetical protein